MLTSLDVATADACDEMPTSGTTYRCPQERDAGKVDTLVLTHRNLVRRIAWHIHTRMSAAIEVDDLVQIGLIALVEAAKIYEPRGASFATYANTRIRGAMIDALRRDAPMSRRGMQNRRQLAGIRSDMELRLSRSPSDAEMAAEMGITGPAYRAMVETTHSVRYEQIDESYNDHDILFRDQSESADELIEKSQQSALLAANLSRLSARDQLVLNLYFVEEMNLEEIGLSLGIGSARVCQIKKAALSKLRDMMDN